MTPDVKQVGGTHYSDAPAGHQHWDLMETHDVAYLEATATKYVVRWRKKGGVEDLRKAVTYLKKMGGRPVLRKVSSLDMLRWRNHNRFDYYEDWAVLVQILDEHHGSPGSIMLAIASIERMIEHEESR